MVYKAVLKLPTYSKGRGEKKRTNLFSMNIYRNMHYLSLNKVKRDYHKEVEEWNPTGLGIEEEDESTLTVSGLTEDDSGDTLAGVMTDEDFADPLSKQ